MPGFPGDFKLDLVFESDRFSSRWLVTLIGREDPAALARVLHVSADPGPALETFERETRLFFEGPAPEGDTRSADAPTAPSRRNTTCAEAQLS
ncbi:MAG: hypothetical protein AB1716_19600 [Planctomycetota bacterium]